MMTVTTANARSAPTPSMNSLRGSGLRSASVTPITRGATVTMPIASDANQCCQVLHIGAVGLWSSLIVTIPPIPEAAVAAAAGANSPNTLRRLLRVNLEPKWRSISHAASRASPVLHRAKAVVLQTLRSPIRLAMIVATIAPLATANRALRPSAIRTPEDTPAAGQKGQRHQVWQEAQGSAAPRRSRRCQPRWRARSHQSKSASGRCAF